MLRLYKNNTEIVITSKDQKRDTENTNLLEGIYILVKFLNYKKCRKLYQTMENILDL